jgi:hypothetical protein
MDQVHVGDVQRDGIREGAVAFAEQDADVLVATAPVGRGQVELAVGVEVAGGQRERVRAGGGGPRRLEAAVAVAQQHADGAVAGRVVVVRCGQVEFTVIIEVRRHDVLAIGADGETHGRAEAEQAAVFEDFATRPADGAGLRRTAPAQR